MYAKIFRSIFYGTLADDPELRHMAMDFMVLMDPDGVLDMTPNAIAAITRVPVDRVKYAINRLTQPDPQSRSSAEEGRFMVPLDGREWGWQIVNAITYRGLRDAEQQRALTRVRVQRHRAQKEAESGLTRDVTLCNARNAIQTDTQTQTQTEKTKTCAEQKAAPAPPVRFPIGEVVIILPTIRKLEPYRVTRDQVTSWTQAFPGVNVDQELRKMQVWLEANPRRRKTVKGSPSFIVAWLGRAQDSVGGVTAIPTNNETRDQRAARARDEARELRRKLGAK